MLFFLGFVVGISQAQAQQLQLISKNESATQSTYVLQAKYVKIQLQLKKIGVNQVQVRMRKADYSKKKIGEGKVVLGSNGQVSVSLGQANEGTLGAWVFAMNHIGPGAQGISLIAHNRMRALKKCKDYCADKIKGNQQVIAAFVVADPPKSGNTKRPDPEFPPMMLVAEKPPVEDAFTEYMKCVWKCMKKMKEKKQGGSN